MAKTPSRSQRQDVLAHPGSKPEVTIATGLSPEETARYIAEFSAELSYLARRAKLDLLAYLLDMAKLEAAGLARKAKDD
ncbi:hypothetical protein [Microvirga pudoricolor]|uniref:hypothetical protein n=1 Tax=Microvirga pudoricolor TaxID=2778729 RepID=UPI00194F0496|nr:hypothetical protein [Microvirga pudoricolor]MBM6594175.1 hypothetical protein [Microvirga pudoricolor]